MNELHVFLKSLRTEKNISLRQASKDIGISHTYLDSLEKGFDPRTKKERTPTPEVLKKLSKYYNVPYIKLLNLVYNFEKLEGIDESDLLKALYIEDEDEINLNKISGTIANGKVFTLDPDQRLSNEDSKTVASIMSKTAFLLYHGPDQWGTDPLKNEINSILNKIEEQK